MRKLQADLGDTGELIAEMAAWSQGLLPAFHIKWTPIQLQTVVGRPFTGDESDLIAHLAGLAYGLRTVAGQVGTTVSCVASTTRIVEMHADSGTPFVCSGRSRAGRPCGPAPGPQGGRA